MTLCLHWNDFSVNSPFNSMTNVNNLWFVSMGVSLTSGLPFFSGIIIKQFFLFSFRKTGKLVFSGHFLAGTLFGRNGVDHPINDNMADTNVDELRSKKGTALLIKIKVNERFHWSLLYLTVILWIKLWVNCSLVFC